jgi:hypothetical protein
VFYELKNTTNFPIERLNVDVFVREVAENNTNLPPYSKLDEELDLISIVYLDGRYSNRFDILEISKPLDLLKNSSQKDYDGSFENLESYMYSFENWQLTQKKHCRIDMKYHASNINALSKY